MTSPPLSAWLRATSRDKAVVLLWGAVMALGVTVFAWMWMG